MSCQPQCQGTCGNLGVTEAQAQALQMRPPLTASIFKPVTWKSSVYTYINFGVTIGTVLICVIAVVLVAKSKGSATN